MGRLILFFGFILPSLAFAKEPECPGVVYKIRAESAPIYAEPDEASEVLFSLKISDRVCHIGEQGNFAILKLQDKSQSLGFASLRDVRPLRIEKEKSYAPGLIGVYERAVDYMRFMYYGGVPDDPFMPVRPLLGAPEIKPLCTEKEQESCIPNK